MARVLKRSTTKVSNTLKSGNIAIGVNNVNYGPTSVTGFYAGVPIPVGGYSVYKTFTDNKFAAYAPQSDVELLRVLNHLGANSTTVTQALAWAATQNEISITGKSYDNIITDNLILNLDARFINSYPRSGSTWYDINGDPNNCTLFNTPTYNTNQFLQFDGLDDYGQITNTAALQITGDQTLEFVVYPRRRDRRQNWYDKAYGGEGTITYETNGGLSYFWGTAGTNNQPYQGVGTSGAPLATLNKWYHVVLVRELSTPSRTVKWYINGVLNRTTEASYTAAVASSTNIRISLGYTNYFQGDIQTVRIYNKALSQAEVLQNYYKASLVTTNLTHRWDFTNLISYAVTGTTVNNMIGSVNGVLTNAPTFGSNYMTFDGSNDFMELLGGTSAITLGNGNTSWTVNAWVKTTTNVNGLGQGSVLSNSSGGPVYSMMGVNSGKIVYWAYYTGPWYSILGTSTINDNKWHMLTWVQKSDYTMDMYVDGKKEVSNQFSRANNNNPVDRIGGSWSGFLSGSIGEVQINTTAFNENQVLQQFNSTSYKYI